MSDILRDFDKKNEFPKVPLEPSGIDFAIFDFIADAIREREDNDIAMEFTKCIGELLGKNGVAPKIKKYTREIVKEHSIEQLYGVTIDELDFTAHDKAFEDKIAKLEKEVANYKQAFEDKCKDYDFTSELLNKFGVDNESLEQRIAELERKNEQLKCDIDKMATSKSEWIDKAVEWQQKCEKLENKETEKPTKINLNDIIKVKLAPLGAEIYYHQYDEVNKKIKKNGGTELEPLMPQIDKDGFTEFQLWHFMELYGKHIGMCKPNVIEPLNIIIAE